MKIKSLEINLEEVDWRTGLQIRDKSILNIFLTNIKVIFLSTED